MCPQKFKRCLRAALARSRILSMPETATTAQKQDEIDRQDLFLERTCLVNIFCYEFVVVQT
jgi:hypothetical protein